MRDEKTQLESAVQDMASADAKLRLAAAKALFSAGLREQSAIRAEVLGGGEAWNLLLAALKESDAKIVENAAGAVAQVLARYRTDSASAAAARDPLRALSQHKNKQIRMYAARALCHARDWTAVEPVLEDKVEAVRKEAVLGFVHRAADIPPAIRKSASARIRVLAAEAGPEWKPVYENALRVLESRV